MAAAIPEVVSRSSSLRVLLTTALTLSFGGIAGAQSTAYTTPVGVMAYRIHGGTADAPVTTVLTLPLADTPAASGATIATITALNGDTLTAAGAGWTDSALAMTAFPYDARFTSGNGIGARVRITANTTDTLTVTGRHLAGLDIAAGTEGDTFELVPVDTLATLFAGDTLLGGDSATSADTVTVLHRGDMAESAYYNSTVGGWIDASGPVNLADDVRLNPEGLIAVTRRGEPMTLLLTGRVASTSLNLPVANSGSTYTHAGFPVDMTLAELNLNTRLPGWVSDADPDAADLVGVSAGASWVFYFHNGSNWQRALGADVSRDDVVVEAGKPFRILRRGSAAGDASLVIPNPVAN